MRPNKHMRRFLATFVAISGLFASVSRGASFYVNDTNTAGDVFATAPGSTSNSGTTASDPAASIQQIFDTRLLAPGDIVYVDAGYYLLTQDVAVVSSGAPGQPITIQGAGTNTVLDGGGNYGLRLNGASYVLIQGLTCSNALNAVRMDNGNNNQLTNCLLVQANTGVLLNSGSSNRINACQVANAVQAVQINGGAAHQINNCLIGGSSYGVYISQGVGHLVNGGLISGASQAVRIENSNNDEVRGSELTGNACGVVLSAGSGHRVDGCNIHQNNAQGILGSSSDLPVILNNQIHNNVGSGGDTTALTCSRATSLRSTAIPYAAIPTSPSAFLRVPLRPSRATPFMEMPGRVSLSPVVAPPS